MLTLDPEHVKHCAGRRHHFLDISVTMSSVVFLAALASASIVNAGVPPSHACSVPDFSDWDDFCIQETLLLLTIATSCIFNC
jgi:hypothetical protein